MEEKQEMSDAEADAEDAYSSILGEMGLEVQTTSTVISGKCLCCEEWLKHRDREPDELEARLAAL